MVPNLAKTNITKLITSNLPHCAISIGYKEKYIEDTVNTKFLCLQIDSHLKWKNHIDQMIPILSGACYAVRSAFHISKITPLKSTYFAYFHSTTKYGTICWGNSFNSRAIFTLQKKTLIFMDDTKSRTACRNLLSKLEMLPVPCQHELQYKQPRTF